MLKRPEEKQYLLILLLIIYVKVSFEPKPMNASFTRRKSEREKLSRTTTGQTFKARIFCGLFPAY